MAILIDIGWFLLSMVAAPIAAVGVILFEATF